MDTTQNQANNIPPQQNTTSTPVASDTFSPTGNATKKCRSCKSDIDARASKCPHCQADQHGWFRRHPIWTGLLVLFIIGIFVSAASGGNKSSTISSTQITSSQSNSPTNTQAIQTLIIVDASAFVAEYDKNKLAAQDKYTGKVVQTKAFISNISQDITGNYYLALNPTNDQYYAGTSMQCYFKDKSVLTSLSNGQSVTVKGTVQDMTLGIVGIQDCSLVK